MPDILPDEVRQWQGCESRARSIFHQYGYEEIRTPVCEETVLFKRGIGEETDIVQKQMYSFKDRGDRDITLRPEGTAPVIRAYLEHSLDKKSPICKVYYCGPMFRSERPQAGRNRQFHQIGIELIGSSDAYMDAEVIQLMMKTLSACGLDEASLQLNSLGCEKDKAQFAQTLKEALSKETDRLCEDCSKRYTKNVLRIFDCKNDACRQLLRTAPKITDHICPECKTHFDKVKQALESVGVKHVLNPFLVRGLDYYTGVVFEVTHTNLGSQDAVAAGGRYDNLIEDFGGPKTPACGFAIGVDRLLLASKENPKGPEENRTELFLVLLGEAAQKEGFKILSELRNKGIASQMGIGSKSLKSQMRYADRVRAKKTLIIGEEELKKGAVILRDMDKKQQKEIKLSDVTNTHLW